MRTSHAHRRSRGFSLLEVMVSLIVICVGLLGIAKMQSLALSNATTSRLRSLAAIEAASLASSMHSNRLYWSSVPANFTVTMAGGAIASPNGDPALATQANQDLGTAPNINVCIGNAGSGVTCTPQQLAAFDLARWTFSLVGGAGQPGLLPNPGATVSCPFLPGVNVPTSCTIVITWTEKAVAINQQEAGAAANAQFQTPTYTLYVEP